MADRSIIQDIVSSADSIERLLAKRSHSTSLLKRVGLCPELALPDDGLFLTDLQTTLLHETVVLNIRDCVRTRLVESRQRMLKRYEETIACMSSVEKLGGMTDHAVERQLCSVFENMYSRHCDSLIRTLRSVVSKLINRQGHNPLLAAFGFTPSTIDVLESIYSGCDTLTPAENDLVAMLAGITPTQTRTWFQNRRNRHKGENYKPRKHNTKFTRHVKSLPRRSGTRPPQPTSSSSIDQVSLGLQSPQITTSEDGSRSTRAVSIASSSSSSSTSSYDSSVDSNGGFIPPYNYLQSVGEPQMTVCFDTGSMYVPVDYLNGAIPPTFNFNPSNLPTVDGSIIPTQQFTNVIPDVGVGQDGTMILSDGNMCSSSASFNPYPTPSLTPINEMYPSYPAPNCAPTPMLALDEIESLMQDALKYTGGKSLDTLLSSPQVTEVDVSSPATENSPPYSESSGESLFPIQLPAEGDGFDIFSELENFIASQNNTGYTPSPGVESLTSSPLQLAEDPDSPLQDIATLFPLFDDMGFATTCEGDVKIQQGKGLEDDKVWKEMRAAAGEGEGLMGEGWW